MEADGDAERRFGLCASCRFARRVRTAKGSEFLRCGRSEIDRAFPRYPRLPVVRCEGFESDGAERR